MSAKFSAQHYHLHMRRARLRRNGQLFACAVLEGTYEATLAVAAILTVNRASRVKVFLTAVGGGAFGNRSMWIVNAIERALFMFSAYPLDVFLVHFGSVPRGSYASLEKGRSSGAVACVAGTRQPTPSLVSPSVP